MKLLQPRYGAVLQFGRELYHRLQLLVGHSASNVIDRLDSFVVEDLESLNDLWTGLYREF